MHVQEGATENAGVENARQASMGSQSFINKIYL